MMERMGFALVATIVLIGLIAGCTQAPAENDTNVTGPPPVQPLPPNATPPEPPRNDSNGTASGQNATYEPSIDPAGFTNVITNRYFELRPGKRMVYEGETEDGTERIETYVTNQTKMVMGVEAVIVWDRVWLEGDLIEETYDWYAQDEDGNVWYFGEDSREMAGGIVTSTHGSWEAGVDGAKPGIIMEAEPAVNDSYKQEYYAGVAEDMATVLALGESVSVPYGNMSGCVKTLDWTPLEPGAEEHKFYCPAVGGVALEVVVEDGERVELISVEYGSAPTQPAEPPKEPPKEAITEEEAKAIALSEVPGKVTDVAIETKFGRLCYVVEIDADSGPETDVIIDRETGEVLGVET